MAPDLYGNIFSRSMMRKNAAAELNVMNMHDRTIGHVCMVGTTMLHANAGLTHAHTENGLITLHISRAFFALLVFILDVACVWNVKR